MIRIPAADASLDALQAHDLQATHLVYAFGLGVLPRAMSRQMITRLTLIDSFNVDPLYEQWKSRETILTALCKRGTQRHLSCSSVDCGLSTLAPRRLRRDRLAPTTTRGQLPFVVCPGLPLLARRIYSEGPRIPGIGMTGTQRRVEFSSATTMWCCVAAGSKFSGGHQDTKH